MSRQAEAPTRAERVFAKRGSVTERIAKKKKDDREPGQVSAKLRRRMGPELADIFDKFGPETYGAVVLGIKDVLKSNLDGGIAGVEGEVREELGRRGVDEAREHFRAWMDEFVEDLIKTGMDEASVTVEEIGDSLVAEFASDEEGGEEEDLFDVDFEEEDVVEEEDVEPDEDVEEVDLFGDMGEGEEEGGEEALGLDLEALDFAPTEEGAAAGLGRGRFRRPAPRRRFRGASRRRRASRPRGDFEVLSFRDGSPVWI